MEQLMPGSGQAEMIEDLLAQSRCTPMNNPVACRCVPGDQPHRGGPDCWCGPILVRMYDDTAVQGFLRDVADRPERQVM